MTCPKCKCQEFATDDEQTRFDNNPAIIIVQCLDCLTMYRLKINKPTKENQI